MALSTKKEGNVVTQLASATELPRMVRSARSWTTATLSRRRSRPWCSGSWSRCAPGIRTGMRVAITCGSRGVANIAIITRAIVDFVKSCGGEPFVFPAMGSHGGATAEGQLEILRGYGVTEEFLGCPIFSSMEVVQVGETEEGMPVFVDHYAYQADGVILCGRVKAHTAFRGPYESGILKMAVIGMGKQPRGGARPSGRLLRPGAAASHDRPGDL